MDLGVHFGIHFEALGSCWPFWSPKSAKLELKLEAPGGRFGLDFGISLGSILGSRARPLPGGQLPGGQLF